MAENIWSCSIISATYGSRDCTAFMQKKLLDYPTTPNFDHNSWSFTASNDFFGLDPNPGIPKVAVITFRWIMDNGHSVPQTITALENQEVQISCPDTLVQFQWPDPGIANECVLAAFWLWKDVTTQVKQMFQNGLQLADISSNGIPIAAEEASLGEDPSPGNSKNLTIVYARYINSKWYYATAVQMFSVTEDDGYRMYIPPVIPPVSQRRLNIYAAVWGGKDYTAYVRNKYMTDFLGIANNGNSTVMMNDTHNTWVFNPTDDFFGPDPSPGNLKTFIVVYRIAAQTGTQTGQLIDPSAPPCWTQQWYDQDKPLVSTTQYPILNDVSGFRVAVMTQDHGQVIDIGANADMTPMTIAPNQIMVPLASYAGVDVTQATFNLLYNSGSAGSLVVNPQSFNINDPRPDVVKQFVAVVAYPLGTEMGFTMRTLMGLDGDTIIGPREAPALNEMWPKPYNPPTYRQVTFTNHGLADGWPQVYKDGNVQWCPRPSRAQEALENHTKWDLNFVFRDSVTVDLITDAGCSDRDKVQVNFNIEDFDDPPKSAEFYVAAEPNTSMEVVCNVDGKEVAFFYYIGRGVQFIAQFIGIVAEAVASEV